MDAIFKFCAFMFLFAASETDIVSSNLERNIPDTPFVSIWNSPSKVCESKYGVFLNLSYFDIIANLNHTFEGNEIVIYYEGWLGLYPKIADDGTYINGGIPQNVNMDNHLRKLAEDVESFIPNKTFSGLAVIDWESWRPIFDRNGYNAKQKRYIQVSESIVRAKHPDWSEAEVKNEARIEFETAARNLMKKTLEECRRLRPLGYWGYYGFPRCYNHKLGQKYCTSGTISYNNRLSWLFNTSSAIYPSIYLQERFGTHQQRYEYVYGNLNESLRVRQKYGGEHTPVIAYTRYKYADTNKLYDTEDLKSTIEQCARAGLNGVAMWGSSASFRNKEDCETVRDYVDSSLGPFVKNTTIFMSECSRNICSSHGRCVDESWTIDASFRAFLRDYPVLKWLFTLLGEAFSKFKLFLASNRDLVMNNKGMFRCKCYNGWSGEFCQTKTGMFSKA